MPMSETTISVQNIQKSFGAVHALRGVDLVVEKGTIVGLLGPNGAGKTTLIRILTTLMQPSAGVVSVGGYDVLKEPDVVRQIIGLAGQYAAVDENLTGRENLIMVGKLYHHSFSDASARAAELLEQFGLTDAADRTLKTYSGGMRRRLDLAASLVNRPPVLFLDEPTTGLDPGSRLALWKIIRDLAKAGTTVLLTTQYMEEADYLAEKIVVIDKGKIVAMGTPAELKSRVGGDVLEVHLSDPSRAQEAAVLLRLFGNGESEVDEDLGVVRLPVSEGAGVLPKVIRVLDISHIGIEDLQLRRATLDEAFLKLTGHRAEMV